MVKMSGWLDGGQKAPPALALSGAGALLPLALPVAT